MAKDALDSIDPLTGSKMYIPTNTTPQVNDFLKTGVKFGRFGDTSDDPESMLLKRNQFQQGAEAYAHGLGDRDLLCTIL